MYSQKPEFKNYIKPQFDKPIQSDKDKYAPVKTEKEVQSRVAELEPVPIYSFSSA